MYSRAVFFISEFISNHSDILMYYVTCVYNLEIKLHINYNAEKIIILNK